MCNWAGKSSQSAENKALKPWELAESSRTATVIDTAPYGVLAAEKTLDIGGKSESKGVLVVAMIVCSRAYNFWSSQVLFDSCVIYKGHAMEVWTEYQADPALPAEEEETVA